MINASFAQACPACNRTLRVRRAYLEHRVICQHCKAEFVAVDESQQNMSQESWQDSLLQRADNLLRQVALHAPCG